MPQPRQRRGVVHDLADQATLEDQPEPDLALGVPDGVSDQILDEQFGGRYQLGQAPAPQRAADQ